MPVATSIQPMLKDIEIYTFHAMKENVTSQYQKLIFLGPFTYYVIREGRSGGEVERLIYASVLRSETSFLECGTVASITPRPSTIPE